MLSWGCRVAEGCGCLPAEAGGKAASKPAGRASDAAGAEAKRHKAEPPAPAAAQPLLPTIFITVLSILPPLGFTLT